jgi:hypothetical protein
MLECEDHLTRNSATDVCECSDSSHSEVNVTSGTVCARDCIADEERSDSDPYCQCEDTHEYAEDGETCIELCKGDLVRNADDDGCNCADPNDDKLDMTNSGTFTCHTPCGTFEKRTSEIDP